MLAPTLPVLSNALHWVSFPVSRFSMTFSALAGTLSCGDDLLYEGPLLLQGPCLVAHKPMTSLNPQQEFHSSAMCNER